MDGARRDGDESAAEAGQAPFGVDDALVREVQRALAGEDLTTAAALAEPLHPGDQADLLQLLAPDQRRILVKALGPGFQPETLSHLDEAVRDELLTALGPREAGAVLAQLDSDDAVDVLAGLDEHEREAILAALPLSDRTLLEEGLAFPEYSAGRLMQREFVAVPDYWTVGQTIDYLRATRDLPDEFYDIFIVDPRFRPAGSVPLGRLLRSSRSTPLRELKMKELRSIPVTMDQEKVAFLFRQYGMVSAPVVNAEGRLVGAITIDDVVDVIDEEAEDDLLKLSGVQETGIFSSPWVASRQRIPWLLLSMVSATIGATVIHQFEGSIEQLVSLAVLMPVIAALGGNAGVQTLAVVVRSLAVSELTRSNALRVLVKELFVGALNSTMLMVVGVCMVFLWFGSPGLALVFGGSILVTVCAAAFIGIGVPLLLDRMGFDPAIASSVFVTPTIDALGFFTFLGLATLYLL